MLDDILQIVKVRGRMGRQTVAYPEGPARFPARFRGRLPPRGRASIQSAAWRRRQIRQ